MSAESLTGLRLDWARAEGGVPPAAATLAAYARACMHCHMMGLVHDGDGPDPLRRQLPAAGVSREELDAALCRCVSLAKVLAPFWWEGVE